LKSPPPFFASREDGLSPQFSIAANPQGGPSGCFVSSLVELPLVCAHLGFSKITLPLFFPLVDSCLLSMKNTSFRSRGRSSRWALSSEPPDRPLPCPPFEFFFPPNNFSPDRISVVPRFGTLRETVSRPPQTHHLCQLPFC